RTGIGGRAHPSPAGPSVGGEGTAPRQRAAPDYGILSAISVSYLSEIISVKSVEESMPQSNSATGRISPELIKAYLALETATVYESNNKQGALDRTIRPIYSGIRLCGPALTVQCQ